MGRSKAHLPWGPASLLEHVVRRLAHVVPAIVVVAAQRQSLPELPDGLIMARDQRDDQGPLEGIRRGLLALPTGLDYAYVTSCDAPLLRPAFVAELHRHRQGYDVVVPREGSWHHPLAAIYHRRLADPIDGLLRAGRRRPVFLFRKVPTLELDVEQLRGADPDLATLRNVNTPEDYLRLIAGG